jgi:hypothetical protein
MLGRLDTISASIRTLFIAVLQLNMRNIVRNGNIRGLVKTNWEVAQRQYKHERWGKGEQDKLPKAEKNKAL